MTNADKLRIYSAIAGRTVKRIVTVSTGYYAKPPGATAKLPLATNRVRAMLAVKRTRKR